MRKRPRVIAHQGRFRGKPGTERVGFEPTEACTSTVFETAPIDHSGTSPRASHPDSSAGWGSCQPLTPGSASGTIADAIDRSGAEAVASSPGTHAVGGSVVSWG